VVLDLIFYGYSVVVRDEVFWSLLEFWFCRAENNVFWGKWGVDQIGALKKIYLQKYLSSL